jgi:low temperature requirement protein LtrA
MNAYWHRSSGPDVRPIPLNRTDVGVAPLELYFDLVFVFALTQVTILMAHDIGPESILRGALVLGLLWSGWAGYSWLGNLAATHSVAVRNLLLTAMAAMLVLALTIPEAFHDSPGGLRGPTILAVCYAVFRGLHLLMYWMLSAEDRAMRAQLIRFAPAVATGALLMFVAAGNEGTTQTLLWVAALCIDYVGVAVGGRRGWQLRSTRHFTERHGDIVIIALGETILAIGVAVRGESVSWPIVEVAVLGLTLATALWWVYFDVTVSQAEHRLESEPSLTRAALARDAYSVLHLPMVLGIVLTALGLKQVVQYAGPSDGHTLQDPLSAATLFALIGGIILYLVAHAAFRIRLGLATYLGRSLTVAGLALLWVVGAHLPGHTVLVLVTLAMAGLVTLESVAHRADRTPRETTLTI